MRHPRSRRGGEDTHNCRLIDCLFGVPVSRADLVIGALRVCVLTRNVSGTLHL
jgi:hypothetical protein